MPEFICGAVCPNQDALTSSVKFSLWVFLENKEVFATWFALRYKLVHIRISSMEVSVDVG